MKLTIRLIQYCKTEAKQDYFMILFFLNSLKVSVFFY